MWVWLVHPLLQKVHTLEGRPSGRYAPLQKVHPLVLTSSGGHQSGRHASYWNAFLLHVKTNTIHNNSYLIQTCSKQQLAWNIPIADSSKLLFIKLLILETQHSYISYIVNGDFSLQIPEYWQLAINLLTLSYRSILICHHRHESAVSCLVPLCSLHGKAVTTVEGIGSIENGLHPVQVCAFWNCKLKKFTLVTYNVLTQFCFV